MPEPLHRGHERLRRFRVSLEDTSYFLTLCVKERRPVLSLPSVAEALIAEWRARERDGHIQLRVFTVMPDHMHVLVRITGRPGVSRMVGRVKSKTKPVIAAGSAAWQPNFFEHRMRADEPLEPVVRYMHLNPYRAGLAHSSEIWPWFWCAPDIEAWFVPGTNEGAPFPEWL